MTALDIPSPRTRPVPARVDLVVDGLRAVLGDAVVDDPDILVGYRRDRSRLTQCGSPLALVRARSVDDVTATMKIAHTQRIPVVTRGAGTGLSGGANALDGCIVLSTERMNRIVHVDVDARLATAEAGVLTGDLATAVAAQGLWYPPDPGSRAISTIGGNVATNAGGSCCVKYGVTGDHVVRVKAVLPDGRLIHTGARTRKNVAGLSVGQLLVGSEGTLAVIVEVTVRLRRAPDAVATVVASFPDAARAVDTARTITTRTDPCVVEFMDSTTMSAVEDLTSMGLDSSGALLLIQYDGADSPAQSTVCESLCAHTATEVFATSDAADGEALMQARRMALPALERWGDTLLDDLAVPIAQVRRMLRDIDTVAARYGVRIATFGHLGDGNLHPTIIFDAADAASRERAHQAFDAMVGRCIALGGSLTGEHGVGCLKREHLPSMVSAAELDVMRRIKSAFDPNNVLNPGRGL